MIGRVLLDSLGRSVVNKYLIDGTISQICQPLNEYGRSKTRYCYYYKKRLAMLNEDLLLGLNRKSVFQKNAGNMNQRIGFYIASVSHS